MKRDQIELLSTIKETASEPAGKRTAELLMEYLQRSGVTVIFGQSIPQALLQLAPKYGIRQVSYRTENAGGVMADGFARISGTLGIVAAQNGPAATLLVAPLAEALMASTPVLALVQDVTRNNAGKNAFQELDHEALFMGCTKWIGRVDRPEQAEQQIEAAIRHAVSGRPGPVVLLLPMDLLRETTPLQLTRRPVPVQVPYTRSIPSPDVVRQAAALIAGARRPLLVAGGGIHLAGAAGAIAEFQEEFKVPVATTNMGKGATSDGHPLSLGVIGNCMGESSPSHGMRDYIKSADVVILVGTRTNQNGTDSWRLFNAGAHFIHIDVDPSETNRNYDSLPLIGDARDTVKALAESLRLLTMPNFDDVSILIARSRSQAKSDLQKRLASTAAGVRPEVVMMELAELLPANAIVAADASYSTNWVSTHLPVRSTGDRFLLPRGLAGLGWGFPMAIGAKLARPDSTVVAVVGDGGFGHCWSELEAARREGIAVTVIVFNNRILGYQKHGEELEFGASTNACDLNPVDHALIAQACGCVGLTVKTHAEIRPALETSLSSKVPTVIDVHTDPSARPPLGIFERGR
jgi:acetolactate synthase-1/2/3 large subunit